MCSIRVPCGSEPARSHKEGISKPVQWDFQAAQATFICGWQVASANVDLNGRDQQCRNPKSGVACRAHVDKTRQIDAVVHMDISGALFAYRR